MANNDQANTVSRIMMVEFSNGVIKPSQREVREMARRLYAAELELQKYHCAGGQQDCAHVFEARPAVGGLADSECVAVCKYCGAKPSTTYTRVQPMTDTDRTKLLAAALQLPVFIPTKAVKTPVLPDYVFHTMAVRWPLSAEQIKRLCRELQLEMEKHHEQA